MARLAWVSLCPRWRASCAGTEALLEATSLRPCARLFSLKLAVCEGLLGCFAMRGVAPVLPRQQGSGVRSDRLEAHLLEHAEGGADRRRDHRKVDLLLDHRDGLQRGHLHAG